MQEFLQIFNENQFQEFDEHLRESCSCLQPGRPAIVRFEHHRAIDLYIKLTGRWPYRYTSWKITDDLQALMKFNSFCSQIMENLSLTVVNEKDYAEFMYNRAPHEVPNIIRNFLKAAEFARAFEKAQLEESLSKKNDLLSSIIEQFEFMKLQDSLIGYCHNKDHSLCDMHASSQE